jgi:hypothetical protein
LKDEEKNFGEVNKKEEKMKEMKKKDIDERKEY